MVVKGKIAYLMGAWPVWSETFIQQELEMLVEAGLPVVPIAVFPGNQVPKKGLPPVTILEYAEQRMSAKKPATHTGKWLPGIVRRQAALVRHSGKLSALMRVLQKEQVTHVHSAFAELPGLLASAAAKNLGIGYSVSVHAYDAFCKKYDDRYLFGQAKFVYCCNRRVMNELSLRSPWLAPSLEYLPHGLMLSEWPFRGAQPLQEPLKFLFVGRLIEKKDPHAALNLIKSLKRAGIEAEITFVGDGPLRKGIRSRGVLSRDQVREIMQESDFLISTSRELKSGDMEGVPNVILEAMATGLPVVAAKTGGIGEVLNQDTGFEIDPDDSDAFHKLMRWLMATPEELGRRITVARRLMEHNYQLDLNLQNKIERFRCLVEPAGTVED